MDAASDQPTPTGAAPAHLTPRKAVRSRRRRPTGAPPPLPHHLQTSGVGWLVAAVVLVGLALAVFAPGLRGPAVAVTVADDAVVRRLGELHVPGLGVLWQGLAYGGSWWTLTALESGLLLALLVLRRWRHLLVWLVAWPVVNALAYVQVATAAQRPRPFGVDLRTSWGGWAMPAAEVATFAAVLVAILYTLVPKGRWRNTGKWVAAGLVALVGVARIALGVDAPTDVLVGVVIGVTIPLLAFRWFAPDEVFPVVYRRGRSAHLDVGGARGVAIRRALEEQLGLAAGEIEPFGLASSAGSTPLRITVSDAPARQLFGKLYARSHLRADRWYKLGRELLYGQLEDEKPFNSVRRLVEQEDYALRVMRDAGLPSPGPYGFVELTPDREYLLVTEFFAGAVELSDAEADDGVIDDGLGIIRKLWHAGLAHRDVKPGNLLVRDGHMLLIDVAFAEARPSPWRQAVDLANMMLCLALHSSAEQVYRRRCASSAWRRSARASPRPAGSHCLRSCAACCARKVATCMPSSPGCCPPRPSRSESSGGVPAESACGRRSCSSLPWPPRTGPPCSATREPSRPRSAPTPWAAGIWSRCGWRHNRSRRRRWCRAYGHRWPAGRWQRWPSTTAGRWSPSTTIGPAPARSCCA